MKTNSKKHGVERTKIEQQLKGIPIKKLAKQNGLCKRKAKKIRPKELIVSFMQIISYPKQNTYSNWATKIGIIINDRVSKQAVFKRMTENLIYFLKSLLKQVLERSLKTKVKENVNDRCKIFKRILIEDSTALRLHRKFSKDYPGSRNSKNKDISVLKIQTLYEVVRRRFLRMDITSFRKNDQSYADKIFEIIKQGDLIIRDLGYFSLRVFNKLTKEGIYYISLLRKDVKLYKNEEELIDLAKMLKKRGSLDIEVFAGKEEKVPVRLIAVPVEDSVADSRRRAARNNRDRRLNPGKKSLQLLSWDIFITNAGRDKLEIADVIKLYALRWRIEIIFKTWKSCLGITEIQYEVNRIRLEAFIYCMLIFILLFQTHFYEFYLFKTKNSDTISLLKLTQFIRNNLSLIFNVNLYPKTYNIRNIIDKLIPYYCVYERRSDRVNYNQLLLN